MTIFSHNFSKLTPFVVHNFALMIFTPSLALIDSIKIYTFYFQIKVADPPPRYQDENPQKLGYKEVYRQKVNESTCISGGEIQ
jgi:hypothetical protein